MKIPQHIEGVIRRKATEGETTGRRSFYIYDTTPLRQKVTLLKTILPKSVAIYYAMKANPHPAFLKAAQNSGVSGVEIASLGEAVQAVAAGYSAHNLIYTGPGKTEEELRWSVEQGVRTVHVESLTEAYRLNKIAAALGKQQDILLRVNANFHIHGAQANFSGDSSKLGVDESKLFDVLSHLAHLDRLTMRGLHVYSASGLLRVDDLLKNCELVFDMVKAVEEKFSDIRCDIIDFGGGFGIDYLETGHDFSPETYAAQLIALIDRYQLQDRHFVLELGRYLAADSGWYCTEIVDIKDSLGTKQIITAGGTNHFRRPAALQINHPVVIIPMHRAKIFAEQEGVHNERVYIGGPLCNSADKIAKDIPIPQADIGDIVVCCLAGAYGLTMSHIEFLGHQRPEEIVVTSQQA